MKTLLNIIIVFFFCAITSNKALAELIDDLRDRASEVSINQHFAAQKRIQELFNVQPHEQDLLGDAFDKSYGRVGFEHVDISLPGNSALPVEIRRRYTHLLLNELANKRDEFNEKFSDWQLVLPSISHELADALGTYPTGFKTQKQCSMSMNPNAHRHYEIYTDLLYWSISGTYVLDPFELTSSPKLNIPGQGAVSLMNNDTHDSDTLPGANKASYPYVTKNQHRISCIDNGEGNNEGFLVQASDGTKYYLNHMIEQFSNRIMMDPVTARSL